jgi:hypothetical protein
MQKYTALAAAIGVVAALAPVPGGAQSDARICRQFEREARELRQGFDQASLRHELRRVERQVRRAGCSGLRFLFGGAGKRECRALRSDMHRLERQLGQARAARSPERRLRGIEAEMRRHGCATAHGYADARGGYRTLCVRRCDGYFFPISFAARKSDLERDRAVCKAFYPEGAADLYFHPSQASQEEEAMVSLGGETYAGQPFAFGYRAAYRPECAAMLQTGIKAGGEGDGETVAIDLSAAVPIPVPRPHPEGSDGITASPGGPSGDPGQVRIVGPTTPYIISEPADGSTAPAASAPKRVAPVARGLGPPWREELSSRLSISAQAHER